MPFKFKEGLQELEALEDDDWFNDEGSKPH
jgi:hypothetical protein